MWLHVPHQGFASSPSALEPQDLSSASSWLFQAFARSVSWRGTLWPPRTWRRRWKRAPWLRRLCGAILRRSTAVPGVAEFISSLPVIPASPSALPASVAAPRTPGACGPKCGASLAKWNRDSSSWRTWQATSFSDSPTCLASLPKMGMTRRGSLCRLRTWAPRMGGSGSSAWPTANAGDGTRGEQTYDGKRGLLLDTVTRKWPTPRAHEHNQANSCDAGQALSRQATRWPTPRANDYKAAARLGRHRGQLNQTTEQIFPCSLPAPTTSRPGSECSNAGPNSHRRLNPAFVEWLMGWPAGWTGFGCSATELSRYKRRWRLLLSRLLSGNVEV